MSQRDKDDFSDAFIACGMEGQVRELREKTMSKRLEAQIATLEKDVQHLLDTCVPVAERDAAYALGVQVGLQRAEPFMQHRSGCWAEKDPRDGSIRSFQKLQKSGCTCGLAAIQREAGPSPDLRDTAELGSRR